MDFRNKPRDVAFGPDNVFDLLTLSPKERAAAEELERELGIPLSAAAVLSQPQHRTWGILFVKAVQSVNGLVENIERYPADPNRKGGKDGLILHVRQKSSHKKKNGPPFSLRVFPSGFFEVLNQKNVGAFSIPLMEALRQAEKAARILSPKRKGLRAIRATGPALSV